VSTPTQILCIDDERNIRTLLEYNLRLEGYTVWLASSGKKGLRLARKKLPDLILLDIMMPKMDGLEVLAELKKDEETRNIPVFMLTAKNLIGDMERAFAIGADDYITKPFQADTLGETLRRKLENHAFRGWTMAHPSEGPYG
jgi:two-component system alkaline phosphatase synthesis response regulator PhoP